MVRCAGSASHVSIPRRWIIGIIAITRPVSATLTHCELTHLAREPIDVARATAQHAAYERALVTLGATLVRVAAAHAMPDAVFIEDTAVVLDELAVITRPGAASRRDEPAAVAAALAPYRALRRLDGDATLDGGDVLRLGRTLYVGRSARTNDTGIEQLRAHVTPFGYRVVAVEFAGCLHLKSAATEIADGGVLVNPQWVPPDAFADGEALAVDAAEPYAANALRLGGALVYPSAYPRTRERLERRGLTVVAVECDELAKAEGAVTCCSLVFDAP